MLRLVISLMGCVVVMSLGGCATCSPSVAPMAGMIASCCVSTGPRGYYWTGHGCAPDETCQCDSRRASPEWDTLSGCEKAHRGCTDSTIK